MKTRPFVLGFFQVAGLVPTQAAQFGDFGYESDGTAVNITGYTGPGGAVTIPDRIDSLPVTSIRNRAFRDCTGPTSVTISESVTSIGGGAFATVLRRRRQGRKLSLSLLVALTQLSRQRSGFIATNRRASTINIVAQTAHLQSAREGPHSKPLREDSGRRASRQRLALPRPSAAFKTFARVHPRSAGYPGLPRAHSNQ
ncbi:hypothetical protein BAC2_01203 [uncultured bacterium]|nr:hypothetical protein BAC2_01203 [uncultured bacterium]